MNEYGVCVSNTISNRQMIVFIVDFHIIKVESETIY